MSSDTFKPRTDFTPRQIADAQSPQVIRPKMTDGERNGPRIWSANKSTNGGYVDPRDHNEAAQGNCAPRKPGY